MVAEYSPVKVPESLHSIFRGRMPLPPGINKSYQTVRVPCKGRMVYRLGPTPELVQFKKDAALTLKQAWGNWDIIHSLQQLKRQKSPLKVSLEFYYPTLWKSDVDGGIKSAMDAAFGYMDLNDNLVTRMSVEKFADREDPHCAIEVSLIVEQ